MNHTADRARQAYRRRIQHDLEARHLRHPHGCRSAHAGIARIGSLAHTAEINSDHRRRGDRGPYQPVLIGTSVEDLLGARCAALPLRTCSVRHELSCRHARHLPNVHRCPVTQSASPSLAGLLGLEGVSARVSGGHAGGVSRGPMNDMNDGHINHDLMNIAPTCSRLQCCSAKQFDLSGHELDAVTLCSRRESS